MIATANNPKSSQSSSVNLGNDVNVIVNYVGVWSGNISSPSGTQNIGGSGEKTINLGTVKNNLGLVSVKAS